MDAIEKSVFEMFADDGMGDDEEEHEEAVKESEASKKSEASKGSSGDHSIADTDYTATTVPSKSGSES